MPKQIDHAAYRLELALKAATLFSDHGYAGLGMRKIAIELGISKSALYHYFPNKKALFHACTDVITRSDSSGILPPISVPEQASLRDKIHMLMETFEDIEANFPQEMSLLFDYLRGRSREDIASDTIMHLANARYLSMVALYVGKENAPMALSLVMGALMQRHFDGGATSLKDVEAWLVTALGA